MMPALLAVLTASLLGSLHCAGMCGGIVAFYSAADRRSGVSAWPSHLSYHGARLVLYVALGSLAGVAGGWVDVAGELLGVQRAALVLAGLVLIAYGVRALLVARGVRVPAVPGVGALSALVRLLSTRLGAASPLARAALLGALTGLLPCGWLYAFVATAVGAGSPLGGAAVMAVFWAGTLPMLLSLAAGARLAIGRFTERLPTVVAVLLIASGAWGVVTRGRAFEHVAAVGVPAAGAHCHDDPGLHGGAPR